MTQLQGETTSKTRERERERQKEREEEGGGAKGTSDSFSTLFRVAGRASA